MFSRGLKRARGSIAKKATTSEAAGAVPNAIGTVPPEEAGEDIVTKEAGDEEGEGVA